MTLASDLKRNAKLSAILIAFVFPALALAQDGSALWTCQDHDASSDKFTGALHADLTGGERDGGLETASSDLPTTHFNGPACTYTRKERRGKEYVLLATTSGEKQCYPVALCEDAK